MIASRRSSCFEKHPRIRGESSAAAAVAASFLETSPHTRGKRSPARRGGRGFGNIPAYAGKASHARLFGAWSWKHPRIRGESSSAVPCAKISLETSPHTRGKHVTDFQTAQNAGNIPAYAGKARLTCRGRHSYQKHPRIRGESFSHLVFISTGEETSPHTRGKQSSSCINSIG